MKLLTIPAYASTAVHIALHWSGLSFEVDIVDSEKLQGAHYRAVNPECVVPALVHGDFILTQTIAIMAYIDDLAPNARLFGDGSIRQRAEAMRWLAFLNSDLHASFGPAFAPQMYLQGEDAAQQLRPAALKRVRRQFEQVDERLAKHAWLAGPRTCADANLFVACMWADMFNVDLADLNHLGAMRTRISTDPGVKAVLVRESLI